jgi:hypothetical protein
MMSRETRDALRDGLIVELGDIGSVFEAVLCEEYARAGVAAGGFLDLARLLDDLGWEPEVGAGEQYAVTVEPAVLVGIVRRLHSRAVAELHELLAGEPDAMLWLRGVEAHVRLVSQLAGGDDGRDTRSEQRHGSLEAEVVVLDSAEREVVREEALTALSGIGDVQIALSRLDWSDARRLSDRHRGLVRLLDGLGWEAEDRRTAYPLSIGSGQLLRALAVLEQIARDNLGAYDAERAEVRDELVRHIETHAEIVERLPSEFDTWSAAGREWWR